MAKVVVTGATGFIGSKLCKKLVNENFEVHIISRFSSTYENLSNIKDNINIFEYNNKICDLINFFKSISPDIVYHLAAFTNHNHKSKDINKLINSNIRFGTHVLEAMYKSNTSKLINTGTYWQHYKNENYNPVNLYAATKQAFEDIIKYYVNAMDFNVITLKLFDTYSEEDNRDKLIKLLGKFSQEKKKLKMSPGAQKIDLVHVDDIVDAFITAYKLIKKKEIEHKKYAVSSGKKITLKDLVKLYKKVTAKEVLIEWGGKPYREREVMEPWDNYELLPGWEPKISLEDGLSRIK
jgi:nucleoside-diphosphate-sugar epimerase